MHRTLLLVAAIVGGILLIAMGFIAAVRKPDKAEAERIRRSDEMMRGAVRDDPNERSLGSLNGECLSIAITLTILVLSTNAWFDLTCSSDTLIVRTRIEHARRNRTSGGDLPVSGEIHARRTTRGCQPGLARPRWRPTPGIAAD